MDALEHSAILPSLLQPAQAPTARAIITGEEVTAMAKKFMMTAAQALAALMISAPTSKIPGQLDAVHGPPGCGKTFTIARG